MLLLTSVDMRSAEEREQNPQPKLRRLAKEEAIQQLYHYVEETLEDIAQQMGWMSECDDCGRVSFDRIVHPHQHRGRLMLCPTCLPKETP